MKEFKFTKHALKQASDRGVSQEEIKDTVLSKEWLGVEYGRFCATKVFEYNKLWESMFYKYKEVKAIFTQENDKIVVITTISRYYKE